MSRVVVIGAGAMGLAAAFRAARNGHKVSVLEAASEAGGMAGHFDLDGISMERFYHFICKTDEPTFALLRELGMADRLRWRPTSMGVFTEGKLYRWGDPVALLRFPWMSPWQKVRYGVFATVCVGRARWDALEREDAHSWIRRWCGEATYERLWKPLLDLKFFEHSDDVSAAWIWTRIRRIGRSRRGPFQEELGYLEGGTKTLVNALVEDVQRHGGRVELSAPVLEVLTEGGRVTGVRVGEDVIAADAVICTVPTPLVPGMIPTMPAEWKARYAAIRNIGCICVVFRLRRSVTPHFWVNVSEPGIEIPGVIEFSNLRDIGGDAVVYVPFYMPTTHPKFSWTDEQLLAEGFACLQRMNPKLVDGDVKAGKVARLRYGQPVCEPGFAAKIPPVETPIAGLQVADTCFYYPEDRGIAESVRLGQEMASRLGTAAAAVGADGVAAAA